LAVHGSDDAMTVLRDRSFMDQMKIDILRRVEAPSDSEDEEVNIFGVAGDHHGTKGKGIEREVAFDDDLEDIGSVHLAGDGEEGSEDEDEDERDEEHETPSVQTIIEMAYIANPKVFERDAATRRSKERAVLRAQTGASHWASLVEGMCAMADGCPLPQGWVDEQIEGFRIMLDRDVRPTFPSQSIILPESILHVLNLLLLPLQQKMKEKMLARHEFSGNKPLPRLSSSGPGPTRGSGTPDAQPQPQSARGRGEGGRGRRSQSRGSRGRGRGRGSTIGSGTGGDGGDAQGHAWKNKNKSRQGNHDRKRGHDRKMGKAGGPSS